MTGKITLERVWKNNFTFLAFSCVADNALGRTKKYIEVSGRPGPAEFISPAYSNTLDRYNLTWTIESIPPLDEIKLLYRKLMMNDTYQHPGKWHDIILVPSLIRLDQTHFVMSYLIRKLDHNSVYEAMVQARNMYGWNEVIFKLTMLKNLCYTISLFNHICCCFFLSVRFYRSVIFINFIREATNTIWTTLNT